MGRGKQKNNYLTREERITLHRKRIRMQRVKGILAVLIFVTVLGFGIRSVVRNKNGKTVSADSAVTDLVKSVIKEKIPPLTSAATAFPDLEISEQYLTPNEYSRPGITLDEVNFIVIHYTANPGTSAQNNRDYFEGLKDTQQTKASSHFVIGLNGEIIQCIPLNEWCYASNQENKESISIEMCHPDESGAFHDATYNACVYLVAQLCNYYHLTADQVIRHYDVTGKECPKYFVDYPEKWDKFRGFVTKWQKEYQNKQPVTTQE